MKTPEEVEKEFFKKFNKNGVKKISLNLSSRTLEMIDEFASILGLTRTTVIEAVIGVGFPEYIRLYEDADKKIRKQEEYEDKKEILNKRIKKVQEFKKKWL